MLMEMGGNTGTDAVELGSCMINKIHERLTNKYKQVKTYIMEHTDLLVVEEEGAPPVDECSTT